MMFHLLFMFVVSLIPSSGFGQVVSLRDPLDKPNIVLFVADDMGYGDLSSYGHPTQEPGPIDKMAADGMRFTQWYSPESLCSPSRGAMLTGRLPVRVGLYGDYERVFLPTMPTGLPKSEITIAEALREEGYATGMGGKWHLGINEFHRSDGNHLPIHHGFDYVGTIAPFTNHRSCDETKRIVPSPVRTMCMLYYNSTIIQQPTSHHNLTETLLHDAKVFIHQNEDRPFLYILNFLHMHDSLFSGPEFKESSKRGEYGDNLNEMSWAVGEVLDTLKALGLDKNTLALFISDHGGHVELGTDGGKNSPFRGSKETSWEGGFRVPAIALWPGVIQGGTISRNIVSTMDLFSTALDLAGATIPTDRVIDGISLKAHLLSSGTVPHSREVIHYYCSDRLMAIRYRDYKAFFHSKPRMSSDVYSALCQDGWPTVRFHSCYGCNSSCITSHLEHPLLYNVETDHEELYPLEGKEHRHHLEPILREKAEHEAGLVKGVPLFVEGSMSLVPCCNPPYCFCNYNS